jgi:diguanylate cyclase (GGDEF)-like protein
MSRKRQLLLPVAALTLGGLILLVALAMYLVVRFDGTAAERERAVVAQGFLRQIEQFELGMAPQSDWDDAVKKLDHKFDAAFADRNFGAQFFTFNGITHTFIIDGAGVPIYASVMGRQQPPKSVYPGFAPPFAALVHQLRQREARRPPIEPTPAKDTVTHPIQAHSLVKIEGQICIVIATLIQPDIGLVLPKGPRAPIVLTAMPVNRAMMKGFAAFYQIDDFDVVPSTQAANGKASVPLRDMAGNEIGAFAWSPRQPGSVLYQQMQVWLGTAVLLFGMVGWMIMRRSANVVDDLIASEAHARYLAFHDTLTGLPNRAMLFERLPVLLAKAGRNRRVLVVMAIDLDRFKELNDTLGHQAGDELLKSVANRLLHLKPDRGEAFAARLGGDEFVHLHLARDPDAARDFADRTLALMLKPVDSDFGRLDVGCSIGLAIIATGAIESSKLLRQADLALYRSKATGRACVTVFEPDLETEFHTRRVIEASLRAALSDQAFHMVYQPQVDGDGKVVAFEALLRSTQPLLNDISPSTFIAQAEECGLIMAIGELVLRLVFEETRGWLSMRIAVNVSAVQMRAHGFGARIAQLVAHSGIDPARYEIELTETSLLTDEPTTVENFAILRGLGFSIALDDFGTGHSSLSLLHRFKVDRIKIDRSFISDLGERPGGEAVVNAIIQLAHSFELGVIAEGVETEEQQRRLVEAGCVEFQGYLFGVPMPASEVEARYIARPLALRA